MTYRKGAYVVDTRSAKFAQVMADGGTNVYVRPPRGGLEWDAPAEALRLATPAERAAAGVPEGGRS